MALEDILWKRAQERHEEQFSQIKDASLKFRRCLLPGRENPLGPVREDSDFLIDSSYDKTFYYHWKRLLEMERYTMIDLISIIGFERERVYDECKAKERNWSYSLRKWQSVMTLQSIDMGCQNFFMRISSVIDQIYYLIACNYKIPFNYKPDDRKNIIIGLKEDNKELADYLRQNLSYCARQLELKDIRSSLIHHLPKIEPLEPTDKLSVERHILKVKVDSSYFKGKMPLFDYLFKFYEATLEQGHVALKMTKWNPDKEKFESIKEGMKVFADALEKHLLEKKKT